MLPAQSYLEVSVKFNIFGKICFKYENQ